MIKAKDFHFLICICFQEINQQLILSQHFIIKKEDNNSTVF